MPTVDLKADHTELVVLSMLAAEPLYGYLISRRIEARSQGELKLGAGKLYPLLSKLERAKLVTTTWEEVKAGGSDPEAPGRRRKWYRLSPKGHKRLAQSVETHRRLNALIESFVSPSSAEAAT